MSTAPMPLRAGLRLRPPGPQRAPQAALPRLPRLAHVVWALACAGAWAPAQAHDSWLATTAVRNQPPGRTVLALGTGNQFAKMETAIAPEYLRQQGCRAGDGPVQALGVLGLVDNALNLVVPLPSAAPAAPQAASISCWVQSSVFTVELKPELVPVYINEVRPPPELLRAWAAIQARGLPWRERYVKHARIELPNPTSASVAGSALPQPSLAQPSGMGLDMVLADDARQLRTDRPVTVQVLRDGLPLPGLAVELRHEQFAHGLWLRTGADGRVTGRLPLPGRWLLRAVDLRVASDDPDTFDSRFVTLALSVAALPAGAAQPGSSLTSNARSASQTAASSAMATEPAVKTPQR